MANVIPVLYPMNDFGLIVGLKDIDTVTGKAIPLTEGAVRAFIATSTAPDADPAEPTLDIDAVHVGNGKWLVLFDASLLNPTLLASLFAAATPYLIIEQTNGIRAYAELAYQASRPALVT